MKEPKMVMTPVATLTPVDKTPIIISIVFNGTTLDLLMDDDKDVSTVADLIAAALKFDNVVDFEIFIQEHEELSSMTKELKEIYTLTRDTRTESEESPKTVMKSLNEFYKDSTAFPYLALHTEIFVMISIRTDSFNIPTPVPNAHDVSDCFQKFFTYHSIQPTQSELGMVAITEDNVLHQWRQIHERKFPAPHFTLTPTMQNDQNNFHHTTVANAAAATTTATTEAPTETVPQTPPVKNVRIPNTPGAPIQVNIIKKAVESKPVRVGLIAIATVIGVGIGGFFAWRKLRG